MKRIIVIMAGGTGTRLWPLSRKSRPKQFHALLSPQTLLQETYERAKKVVDSENIYIATTKDYRDLVVEDLGEVREDHIIIEPATRSTAPAIALAALTLSVREGDVSVATIASDHAIANANEFAQAITTSFEAVEEEPKSIATIGINPTHPSTAFGYIKIGKELEGDFSKRVFIADAFKEKPKAATARKYLAGWEYLWNAGYFTFRAQSFLSLVDELAPDIATPLKSIRTALESENPNTRTIEKHYLDMPETPIDTAIMENLPKSKRLVIPTDLEWDDIGNWEALYTFLNNRYSSSMIARGNHIDLGSDKCYVNARDRLIATLNLKNIVIIESDDALLVADRKTVGEDIKKLIKKLKEEGKCPYL